MKKFWALLLTLTLTMSLAACSGASADNKDSQEPQGTVATTESTKPAETPAPTEKPSETTEPSESTEAPTETAPAVTTPAIEFDKNWAGAEYELPIPQPPFTTFEISGEDGDYQIMSTNKSEIAELTHQDIIDYCKILQDLGFTIDMQEADVAEGSDAGYQFEATNADGVYCYVALMDSRQAVYILIETE